MSGEVEFVQNGDEPGRPAAGEPPAGRSPTLAGATVAWVAAAVLAVVAPFQRLYGGSGMPRRYADYLPSSGIGVDWWGRGVDGVRFGVALTGCAVVFAVLAVLGLVRLLSATRPAAAVGPLRARTVLAIAAPCLLAGVVACLALVVTGAVGDFSGPVGWTTYAPLGASAGPTAYSSTLAVAVETGSSGGGHAWCLWLAVAALACACLAGALQLRADRDGTIRGRTDLAG